MIRRPAIPRRIDQPDKALPPRIIDGRAWRNFLARSKERRLSSSKLQFQTMPV
jgi:hypothetical protein